MIENSLQTAMDAIDGMARMAFQHRQPREMLPGRVFISRYNSDILVFLAALMAAEILNGDHDNG